MNFSKGDIYMKIKGFTMIEILIGITIISILAALGTTSYIRYVERSKSLGCQQKLKLLKHSLDQFAEEYDVFPASLAQLEPRHIKKAYTKVIIDKQDLFTKIGYYLLLMDIQSSITSVSLKAINISAIFLA